MKNAEIEVAIAWLLLVPIVFSDMRTAFAAYRADAKLWKLIVHAAALTCLGLLVVDLGMVCLRIKYDQNTTYLSEFSKPKVQASAGGVKRGTPAQPARPPAPAKQKPGQKK